MKQILSIATVAALAIGLAGSGVAQIVGVPGGSAPADARNISGTVTDPSGAPAADVEVGILPALGATRSFRTDGQGRYSLEWRPVQLSGLVSGITYSVMARDQSHNLVAIGEIDASTTNQDLRLQTGLTLSGNIEDPDGKPLSAALVQLFVITGSLGTPFNRQPIRVEADGAFNIPGLPRGRQYTLNVRADGYGAANSQISAAQTDTDAFKLPAFVLRLANLPLAGRVLDSNDKPVSGAQVQINGPGQPGTSARTDSQGHFELKVGEGRLQVIAFAPPGLNQVAAAVQAQGGDTGIIIRLAQNPMTAAVNGLRQILSGSSLMLRGGQPKPPLMSLEYFQMWPVTHKKTLYSLAACQLLVLAMLGGGIFWVVRRGRA